MPTCVPACLPACVRACVRACLPACLCACLPPWTQSQGWKQQMTTISCHNNKTHLGVWDLPFEVLKNVLPLCFNQAVYPYWGYLWAAYLDDTTLFKALQVLIQEISEGVADPEVSVHIIFILMVYHVQNGARLSTWPCFRPSFRNNLTVGET